LKDGRGFENRTRGHGRFVRDMVTSNGIINSKKQVLIGQVRGKGGQGVLSDTNVKQVNATTERGQSGISMGHHDRWRGPIHLLESSPGRYEFGTHLGWMIEDSNTHKYYDTMSYFTLLLQGEYGVRHSVTLVDKRVRASIRLMTGRVLIFCD
jgi:hypothetical protein